MLKEAVCRSGELPTNTNHQLSLRTTEDNVVDGNCLQLTSGKLGGNGERR